MGFSSSEIYSLDITHQIIYRKINEKIDSWFEGVVLDIGAGRDLFRRQENGRIQQWISMDYDLRSCSIDIKGDALELPFINESFTHVLCADVLEHLKDPDHAVKEVNRVMRMNGIALVSAPFFLNLHEEPYDFYRFSKYGLQELFRRNGFDVINIERTCGILATTGYWITAFLTRFFSFSRPLLRIILWGNRIFQENFLAFLDRHFDSNGRMAQGHLMVVRKICNRRKL